MAYEMNGDSSLNEPKAKSQMPTLDVSSGVSSLLHSGYAHPLTRTWQSERQLAK
ncbi:hypothetical protein MMC10_008714, partial [Thelotrema lepadinum]|nr:hypothetical protein [Thelotrema lepadinum]